MRDSLRHRKHFSQISLSDYLPPGAEIDREYIGVIKYRVHASPGHLRFVANSLRINEEYLRAILDKPAHTKGELK